MGETRSERRGLPSSRSGEDQHGPFGRQDCFALRRIQALQIGRVRQCGGRFRHLAEVGGKERNGNRLAESKKVPTVVPDIHVIHRLAPIFFACRDSELKRKVQL